MSRIFLIGMPGVGKTYWGLKLASKYGYSFADLDKEVEKTSGMTIPGIFTAEGEAYFRKKETECLEQLCLQEHVIIACGGGTPVCNNNLQLMKQKGCVVYLQTDIDTLAKRLGQDDNRRPLLMGGNHRMQLQRLYDERKTYYEQADYTLQADESIIANFEQIVELCTGRR